MFFFIPIGHEDSSIHRFPFVSLGIVMACLAGFALTWPLCQKEEEQVEKSLTAIRMDLMVMSLRGGDEAGVFRAAMTEAVKARNLNEFLEPIERAIARWESEYSETDGLVRLKKEVQRIKEVMESQVFRRWGLVPGAPRVHTFLTSMFLHAGWLHLIFNLVFFILVAPTLEDLWGRIVFPIVYLASGIAAAIGFMVMSGPIPVPMVGASGAIAGLMGAFLVSFTQTRIRMFGFVWVLFLARAFTFSIPAWVFLPIWIGEEVFQGILQSGTNGAASGGVAHWAHVMGFLFGVGAPFALRASGLDRKLFPLHRPKDGGGGARASSDDVAYMHEADYRRGSRLLEEGDWAGAEECFQAVAEKYPDLPGPRLELAEIYDRDGSPKKRTEVLLQALELAAKGKKGEGIIEIYETLRRDSPRAKLSADPLLRVGMAFERAGHNGEAVEHLRRYLDQFPDHPLRIRAALRLADIFSSRGDFRGARQYLEEFRETTDPLWREEVERRLKETEAGARAAEAGSAPARERLDRAPR